MSRSGYILLLILILQLGLIALLYRDDMTGVGNLSSTVLVDPGNYAVDQLQIADSQGGSTMLRLVGSRWLLPELDNLPADQERIAALLAQLTATDPGWAVGHSLAARQRFQVAHYHFRRKLVLSALDRQLGTVFLGTSPGFRKVHARNDVEDNIYAAELNLFDLPVAADKWLDPRLLQLRTPVAITADGYSLRREAQAWRLGSGDTPDERELQALLNALRNLQVQGIASRQARAALAQQEAELVLQVEALAGNVELQLFKLGDKHYVSSSEYPYPFLISAYEFDRLTGIDSFLLSGAQ